MGMIVKGDIFYPEESEKTDEWKWKALPIKEWSAGISWVMGNCCNAPFEMFGTLAGEICDIGIGDVELRSGRGSPNTQAVCIVPIQTRSDVGNGNLRNFREGAHFG